MINGLSLFANVGIAETYLKEVGVDIVLANELLEERAEFYRYLYPDCELVQGDIVNETIFNYIVNRAKKKNVEFIIATPPCQGMSLAGSKDQNDPRNYLIISAVEAVKQIKPKYVLLENVTMQLKTKIIFEGKEMLIPDYIKYELSDEYNFNSDFMMNTMNYGVPQQRKRAIILMVRKDLNNVWELPKPDDKIVTLKDAIGDLPSLDPFVKEKEYRNVFPHYEEKRIEGLKVSKWHYPRPHVWRNVECMMHTPTGQSARKNEVYYPKKSNGTIVGGAPRTYMRMDWERPAPTITIYNHTISSFQNVHPGRLQEDGTYSDARVLTIFEMMRVMSLPDDWDIPGWASEHLIRTVIGEGVPPLAVKRIVKELKLKEEKK
ncbi:MAG: DNA cytosine methyltransferase [Lachnospiraceae bacterium]|nr:DNA cytosine methyltransferase [Lachnospiraceae bacterium]